MSDEALALAKPDEIPGRIWVHWTVPRENALLPMFESDQLWASWSRKRERETDVEYVRADAAADELKRAVERVEEAWREQEEMDSMP